MSQTPSDLDRRRGLSLDDALAFAHVVAPALIVFAIAYDNGGYSLSSRGFWAIATWWCLILGIGLGWWPGRPLPRPAIAVGVGLSVFAAVTLLSGLWGSSAERAFNEFNRTTFYIGAFCVVVLASSRATLGRWCDGLGLGISAVVGVSLLSRFAPDLVSDRGLAEALPSAAARLSFPLGYWNGLAILAALAIPFLLRAASARRPSGMRALAVAPLPGIAAVIYLASSRGGVATAAIGALVFVAGGRNRWWSAAALAVGVAGGAAVVATLSNLEDFVNNPASSLGREQSTGALVAVISTCAAAGIGYAALILLLRGRRMPDVGRRTLVMTCLVVFAALVVLSDPVSRFRAFKSPPAEATVATDDFVQSHLLSANGSGRWQFWETAVDSFESEPWIGRGAGSYEAWWAQHGSLAQFVRDAHSLYLEALAELGLAGFLPLVAVFCIGIATGFVRLTSLPDDAAHDLAAPVAALVAFVAAAAIDWVWELAAVAIVGIASLALATGTSSPRTDVTRSRSPRSRLATRVVALVVACLVIGAQGIPYLTDLHVRRSQDAAVRGDVATALDAAESARTVQPWAASPWLQLALVREESGDLEGGRAAIAEATDRDPDDWRLWLITARLQTRLGEIAEARRSFAHARRLNPRSPLFVRLERRPLQGRVPSGAVRWD